jgi:uncharacterized membrane protein
LDLVIHNTGKFNQTLFLFYQPMETRLRTWIKVITWCAAAFVLSILIALLVTDDLSKALEIGVLDSIVKIVAHYIHDRLWFKVRWGTRLPTVQAAPEVAVADQDGSK